MKKNNAKEETKRLDVNEVKLSGVVKNVLHQSDKVVTFTICTESKADTEKGSTVNFPTIKWFNPSDKVEEGDTLAIYGYYHTGSYEKDGKRYYTTDVVANKVEALQ